MQDDRIQHLQMIQGVISRMAENSRCMKTWFLAIVSALLGYAVGNGNKWLFVVALVTTNVFWVLDAFYLSLERQFRALYDAVVDKDETIQPFSMKHKQFASGRNTLHSSLFSRSTWPFYLPFAIVILLMAIFPLLSRIKGSTSSDANSKVSIENVHINSIEMPQRRLAAGHNGCHCFE